MSAEKLGPLLWVDWKDHSSGHGWLRGSDYEMAPIVCTTVGFLIREDPETIVLASTVQGQQSSNSRQQILKNCIVAEWELPSGVK